MTELIENEITISIFHSSVVMVCVLLMVVLLIFDLAHHFIINGFRHFQSGFLNVLVYCLSNCPITICVNL